MNTSSMIVLDPSSGAAGDMLLAALIDAGGDRDILEQIEDVVPVEFGFSRVDRSNVNALKVEVKGGGDNGESHHHRSYDEVIDIVEDSGLPDEVVNDAVEVFRIIGEAEASVHGEPLRKLDFHEVGADDAVADVLGVSLLIHDIGERVFSTEISVGSGTVSTNHGDMPVPVPAVSEIMKDSRHVIKGGPVEAELLTPTGAALLRYFTEYISEIPSMEIDEVGYGAGDADFDRTPNVIRSIRGEGEFDEEGIVVLETNVDDVSGEVIGSLYERLMSSGARDVGVIPLMMKKNRPGYLIQAIVRESEAERLARLIARETGTLGVRSTRYTHRFVADRESLEIEVDIGGARYSTSVKLARIDGEIYDVSAEFSDAERIARDAGLPVREVMDRVERQFKERN